MSDLEPLSYVKPHSYPEQDIAQSSKGTATEIPTEDVVTAEVNIQLSVGSPESGRSTSVPSVVGSSGGIYQPRWGMTNDCRLDTPDACQDVVDHIVPPGGQAIKENQVQDRDQRIQVREEEIKKLDQELQSLRAVESEVHGLQNQAKNLKTLLEAKVDMQKAIEAKNAELLKELDSLRVQFSDLQVSNNQLSEQAEQRCTEMDACLDKLSMDLDEERLLKIPVYPEVRGPKDPWAVKEEMMMEDTITANISRAEKKKKCRVVCHAHGICFAHHARFDSILVSAPTVVPQGLVILLADAATQTEAADKEDEPHPGLHRSISLPHVYNL
ncbi:hypothetical protein Tco_0547456 [Tanacetum coccineum]